MSDSKKNFQLRDAVRKKAQNWPPNYIPLHIVFMATMIQDIDTDPAMLDEKRFIEIDPPPPYSSLSEK